MLKSIVTSINDRIEDRSSLLCGDHKFRLHGLVSLVVIGSTNPNEDMASYPSVVNNDGEGVYVFADDDFSFGVYHRLLNRSYVQDKKSFGNANDDVAIDEVLLVCWGFRNILKMDAISFESQIIVPSLPKEAQLVQSVFEQYNVFNGEFKKYKYDLKPEQFLFSTKYKVQYKFNRNCVEIDEENKC